jgi:hypothetical protein
MGLILKWSDIKEKMRHYDRELKKSSQLERATYFKVLNKIIEHP